MKNLFNSPLLSNASPIKKRTSNLFEDANTSLFNTSPTSSHSSNGQPDYVFIPTGYEFIENKKGGESRGFILGERENKENQYLVKQDSIVTEFIGLMVYREITSILRSNIIVPEFFLHKDNKAKRLGLFIKMIPDFVPNSEVRSVHAAPSKKKTKFPGAAYHDLVLMMVISMLIGDNDCSPDNSGSKGNSGVRIDLGNAFYWVYNQEGDFKQKFQDYFRAFYGERDPVKRFMSEFMTLDQLLVLSQPQNLSRIQQSLDKAVNTLSQFMTNEELQTVTFKSESISPNTKVIIENKYESFQELHHSFSWVIRENITKFLPAFLHAIKNEITSFNDMQNAIDNSPPRNRTSSSSLDNSDNSFNSPLSNMISFGQISPILNRSGTSTSKGDLELI